MEKSANRRNEDGWPGLGRGSCDQCPSVFCDLDRAIWLQPLVRTSSRRLVALVQARELVTHSINFPPGWKPRERFEASELRAWSEQRHDVVRFPRDLLFGQIHARGPMRSFPLGSSKTKILAGPRFRTPKRRPTNVSHFRGSAKHANQNVHARPS